MTDKRCPKCGSRYFEIECKVTAYLFYIVSDGIVESNGGDMNGGKELSNTCYCDKCGHKWRPRNFNYTIDK